MANELDNAITIKESIDNIDSGEFLLPAIQRRFVWSTGQIEMLFDSIMQDYPSRTLFLDILNPIINDENKKIYDFKFLIYNNHKKENEQKTKKIIDENDQEQMVECFWFNISKILEFSDEHSVIMFLNENQLEIGGFTGKTLLKLYKLINEKSIINYTSDN